MYKAGANAMETGRGKGDRIIIQNKAVKKGKTDIFIPLKAKLRVAGINKKAKAPITL